MTSYSISISRLLRNENFAAAITACASLIFIAGVASLRVQAAPITFAFDATVTEVPSDFPALNLPFTLSPGQKFSGAYSFASVQDMHDVFFPHYPDGLGKFGKVTVSIGGAVGTAFVNLGSFGDGVLDNPPSPTLPAQLGLSYLSPTDVQPGWNGGIANNRMNTGLILSGPYGSFTNPSDVFDPVAWNRLTSQREFDLQFVYFVGSDLKYVTVKTQVGDFHAVPEPATLKLIWLCVCGWINRGRKERHA